MDLTAEIKELREKKQSYVKEQADKIVLEMIRRKVTTDTLATCDYSNWDRELHRNMPDIATELRSKGLSVSSSVNHGVTDWVFTLNV
jgi:hypothetical protein